MSKPGPFDEHEGFFVERHEEGGVRHLHLSGVIDEFADLSFFSHLKGEVSVHMAGVRRINSFGVRLWMDAVRAIPAAAAVQFHEVPVSLIEQHNMVRGFFGRGRLESFFAPLACPRCGSTLTRLFRGAECLGPDGRPRLPPQTCSTCQGALECDDIEAEYLSFLADA